MRRPAERQLDPENDRPPRYDEAAGRAQPSNLGCNGCTELIREQRRRDNTVRGLIVLYVICLLFFLVSLFLQTAWNCHTRPVSIGLYNYSSDYFPTDLKRTVARYFNEWSKAIFSLNSTG